MEYRNPRRSITCKECQQIFYSREELILHQVLFHEVKNCTSCTYTTYSSARIKTHLCKWKKNLKCPICSKQYKSELHYTKHIEKHTTLFFCKTCNLKSFETQEELDSHRQEKHRKKFICPNCPKVFASSFNMKRHVEQIHKICNCAVTVSFENVCILCNK